jgi:hypothetical protein
MMGGAHLPSVLAFDGFWPRGLKVDPVASFPVSSLTLRHSQLSIPFNPPNTQHTMSVDTTATGEFQPLPKALSDANQDIYNEAYDGIDDVSRLDAKWVSDGKTGRRGRIRQTFVQGAADEVTHQMESEATQMARSDGGAPSALKIEVQARLDLPPAFRNPYTKSGASFNPSRKAPKLSVDVMVTALGLPYEDGATEQTDPKRFEYDVSYNGTDWERVERIVDDGTLVPDDVSQPDAATEASHAAYQ